MTKMKSKKMTKSTFAIIIMAVAMVAMLAFGGTYAYFTAENAKVSTTDLSTGLVQLGVNTITTVGGADIVTNDIVASGVTVGSASDVNTFVVVEFSVAFEDLADDVDVKTVLSYTLDADQVWVESGKYLVTKVAKNTSSIKVCGEVKFIGSDKATTGETADDVDFDNDYMDKDITISIQAWAIQSTGINGVNFAEALDETSAGKIVTELGLGA